MEYHDKLAHTLRAQTHPRHHGIPSLCFRRRASISHGVPSRTFALRDSVDANWQRSDTKPSKKKYTRRHGVTVLRLCRLPSTLSASSNTACCTPPASQRLCPGKICRHLSAAPTRNTNQKKKLRARCPRSTRMSFAFLLNGYSNTACCTPRLSTTVSGTHFQAPEHMFR